VRRAAKIAEPALGDSWVASSHLKSNVIAEQAAVFKAALAAQRKPAPPALLPDLLPNSAGQAGTEANEQTRERRARPTKRTHQARLGMHRHVHSRIRKPLLSCLRLAGRSASAENGGIILGGI
jgi:hypothetical protein